MKAKTAILVLFILLFSIAAANNTKEIEVYLFYGQGCSFCARAEKFFMQLEKEYPELKLEMREVYRNSSNVVLLNKFASEYNSSIGGVPTIFIDDMMITGFGSKEPDRIRQKMEYCLENDCRELSSIEQDGINRTGNQENILDGKNYTYIGWAFIIIPGLFLIFFLLSNKRLMKND